MSSVQTLEQADLAVSVVSHGHGRELLQLLPQLLRAQPPIKRIWLTLNIPEPAFVAKLLPLLRRHGAMERVRTIVNPHPQGFGANHNQAFDAEARQPDSARYFAVLNPDITFLRGSLVALASALEDHPGGGLAYPSQLKPNGQMQDDRRALPTPMALIRRYLFRQPYRPPSQPDWVNAACIVLSMRAYRSVGGFDPRYFMYVEDVDLCLRLQLAEVSLVHVPEVVIMHAAQRRSHREWRHLWWHLTSLLRLWTSSAFWQYRQRR